MENKTATFLYAIKHIGFDGYYKIGITDNLETKLKTFNTASPLGIEVIYNVEIPPTRQAEEIIHNMYISQRRNGEWFEFSEQELAGVIERLNEMCHIINNEIN